ncbi:hypothetical protein HAX54_019852, partial [Datura stramonium]|nr:hypothetical protein [Datura stramonium]
MWLMAHHGPDGARDDHHTNDGPPEMVANLTGLGRRSECRTVGRVTARHKYYR